MDSRRVGVYSTVAITYLRNTMPGIAGDPSYVVQPNTATAGMIGTTESSTVPNANIYLYDIETVITPPDVAPTISSLNLHCLLSTRQDLGDTDVYGARELLGFWIGYYLKHPTLSVVIGPPNQHWEAPVTITVERESLSQTDIEGFFLAARTPLQPSIGWVIKVAEVPAFTKKPSQYPTGWPKPSSSASPKIVITGGTPDERLAAAEQFAALNDTVALRTNVGMRLKAGASHDGLAAGLTLYANAGAILLFDEADFLFQRRPIDDAITVVPSVGTSVVITDSPDIVALWQGLGAVIVNVAELKTAPAAPATATAPRKTPPKK